MSPAIQMSFGNTKNHLSNTVDFPVSEIGKMYGC